MSKKILLVDDSRVSRLLIGESLEKLGYQILGEAVNGELGFEAYKELKPDLVLSDVEMPVLDGYGMVKKIIEYDPDACVVMVTTVVNAQFIKKIISVGAKDAVEKPINEVKLQEMFNRLD